MKCARNAFSSDSEAELMLVVVSAIHDLLEGEATFSDIEPMLKAGFINGNRATWDQTGNWLIKMSKDYPETEMTWKALATYPKAEIRLRVACYIGHLPDSFQEDLYTLLSNDKSAKVSKQAHAKWHFHKYPEAYT